MFWPREDFIIPHLLWHETSVFVDSSKGLPRFSRPLRQTRITQSWLDSHETFLCIQINRTCVFTLQCLRSSFSSQPCSSLLTCPHRLLLHEGPLSLIRKLLPKYAETVADQGNIYKEGPISYRFIPKLSETWEEGVTFLGF